jgi:hypothetical protein
MNCRGSARVDAAHLVEALLADLKRRSSTEAEREALKQLTGDPSP